MNSRISWLVLALVSCSALAQTATPSLDRELTQKQGMTEVGDGLYIRITASGEAYVAVGARGQQALLEKLLDLRAKRQDADSASARAGTKMIDDLIAEMTQPAVNGAMDNYGDCSGRNSTGPFHATASSGGASSAYASASNSDASINTTNQASAYVTDGNDDIIAQQSATTYGVVEATASAQSPTPTRPSNLCQAGATASITCPGQTTPAIRAFAVSNVYPPRACL